MQKIIFLIFTLFFSLAVQAKTSFNQIVFFGDSLTDDGNLYIADFGLLPKSPPYFAGQFSNGEVWSQRVSEFFKDNFSVTSTNYAIGGESVLFHNPFGGYLPYVLSESVGNYLFRNLFSNKSQTLFIILIGANDYLKGAADTDKATTSVVDGIKDQINRLIAAGGKKFLIIDLPDLGQVPAGKIEKTSDNLHALALLHNVKLAKAIIELQMKQSDTRIVLFHLSELFDRCIQHPDEVNKKYGTHITNTTGACWQGGYTLQKDVATLASELKNNKNMDSTVLAKTILASPDLAVAYQVGKSYSEGAVPCANADDYLFWDNVHPTAVTHRVLSEVMVEYIKQNF